MTVAAIRDHRGKVGRGRTVEEMTTESSTDDRAPTGVVARTAGTLRRLALPRHPVGVSQLSRELGLPKSTVHRILALLTHCGAVVREDTRYRLSDDWARSFRPGPDTPRRMLVRLLTPYVMELHLRTGLIGGLVVLRGAEAETLMSLYGCEYTAMMSAQPHRRPAHSSAAGQLLLALDRPGEAPAGPDPGARSGPVDLNGAALHRRWTEIRTAEMAIDQDRRPSGMVEMAVPVRSRTGHPAAALTVSGPRVRIDISYVGTVLRQTSYTGTLALRRLATTPGPAARENPRRIG